MGNIPGYLPKKKVNLGRDEVNRDFDNNDETQNGSLDRYDSVSQRNRMLREKIRAKMDSSKSSLSHREHSVSQGITQIGKREYLDEVPGNDEMYDPQDPRPADSVGSLMTLRLTRTKNDTVIRHSLMGSEKNQIKSGLR